MSKPIQRECLKCYYSMRDPAATPDQIIVGQVQHLCLRHPPTTHPLPTQGGLALMTVYPNVNAQTISCAEWIDADSPAAKLARGGLVTPEGC